MNTTTNNRFVEEVKVAARNNPNIDMKVVREWQEIAKIIENIPPEMTPEQKPTKPIRLQPIPLKMFDQ